VAQLFQTIIQVYAPEQAERYYQRRLNAQRLATSARPLKIGYVSDCLKRHSVGWLARGVFKHHDHDRFQIHGYFSNSKQAEDSLQEWYVEHSCKAYKAGIDALEIAEKIYEDEIDILIDLDSITVDIISKVMALKCAPVQATWLGWDASGLPAIDYFIADPYVLVESAQDYYTEKIWRLPHTYIAVDGFEVGVPTLRRDQLDIPSDAVVYLSAQRGFKRHPDTARLQMKIIKEVPNSYFLIKGLGDQESIKSFFIQIAEEEGVDSDHLRFLPVVPLEEVHRANLGIADVVLDTYPYNGATTTLETLWMGIPLVTRVGEQFAARNSYAMMMNVGVTEGIAWTDEEYVEWGVRLGKDPTLRQQIAWQLRQSRQTAPLWDAKQFTREMEKAYEQMWQRYVEACS
jgi:predicted O-linked N-acetylglucosamine transferase (SPINDLY family)